ncbi:MAG: DUF2807 domain-containing protein [Pseudomonadota bacterium]
MTSKKTAIAFLVAATVGAAAFTAIAETQSFAAEGFTAIDVGTGLEVIYVAGADYGVEADFSRGGPDDVRVEVNGSTLEIRRKRTGWGWTDGSKVKAIFTVTSPGLEAVDVSSGASFSGSGIDADMFGLDVSSGGSVSLEGRCRALVLDVSSGASVRADGLRCAEGTIDASSGASVRAYLSDSVSVDASSGSSVRVSGGPAVKEVDRSSGASVRIEQGEL